MAIDIEQLAAQIYTQTIAPNILERASQGSNLDKLFRGAAIHSIAAAAEFARACETQAGAAPALPVADVAALERQL